MIFFGKLFKKLLAGFFLIPTVLLLYQNQFSNRHTHILPSGEIAEHAHPFKKSNSDGSPASHNHDALELIFFGQLSDIGTDLVSFCLSIVDTWQPADPKSFFDPVCIRQPFIKSNPCRGPPFPITV